MLKYTPLMLLCALSILVKAQTLNIPVDRNYFHADELKSLVVVHLKHLDSFKNLTTYTAVQLKLDSNAYAFDISPNSLSTKMSYQITNLVNSKSYKLYFTQLPLIAIRSTATIVDEPKRLAELVYADEEQVVASLIGIELRGGNSLSHPKKTYDLEFWLDSSGSFKHDVQFKNMRSDDDWILDGLYNEPLRLRSSIASKLWLEMHTPHYINQEPGAKAGADLEYAELFLNGRYEGIYNLSEQVDRKLLKLRRQHTDSTGELYKGVGHGDNNMFVGLPWYNNYDNNWDGYEIKYPKDIRDFSWENLYNLTDFVIYSCDADFTINVWQHFNYENYMDYFMFLNLIRATDNQGKNIYTARYKKGGKYFYVPWDLDGCFGTIWTGDRADEVKDVLANDFHKRVMKLNPANTSQVIGEKWFEYRKGVLSEQHITQSITSQYDFLNSNKVYEREHIVYPDFKPSSNDLTYTTDWVHRRLTYLDSYYHEMKQSKPRPSGNELVLFPNPAFDKVCILNYNEQIDHDYQVYDASGKVILRGNLKGRVYILKRS